MFEGAFCFDRCILCRISASNQSNYLFTFPWKSVHSGAQPPMAAEVGAMVVLTKAPFLLQIEGSSMPQLMSFQKPVHAEFTENDEEKAARWNGLGGVSERS